MDRTANLLISCSNVHYANLGGNKKAFCGPLKLDMAERQTNRETGRQRKKHTEKAAFMAAMRSLCGPLELDMAYDGKLELLDDVPCKHIKQTYRT